MPSEAQIDVLVRRKGTEGLSMATYAEELCERLPDRDVRLARTPAAERDLVRDARVLTGVDADPELVERADHLELFACVFAGTDHVPTEALVDRGAAVTNASGVHTPGIAEQALGFMLTFARRLHEGWHRQERRSWHHFQSYELSGSTVTVVGLGSIGRTVVDLLEGFAVETIGIRHSPEKGGPTDEVCGYDAHAIHDAFARSEYVVLACPLTDLTRGLIDEEALDTLQPSAVLVNVARGPIIETDALVSALRKNEIRGAGLDVTDPEPLPADHPLWNLENCLVTPHTGGHNPQHWPRLADIVAHNVRALDGEGELRNVVATP